MASTHRYVEISKIFKQQATQARNVTLNIFYLLGVAQDLPHVLTKKKVGCIPPAC